MPRIADYSTIKDLGFEIGTGGDIDRTFFFTLPSDASVTSNSILAYVIDTIGSIKNLKLRVTVNKKKAQELTLNSHHLMTLHEIMGGDYLQVGQNEIRFHIYSGSGKLKLSDVVLWWQRDV